MANGYKTFADDGKADDDSNSDKKGVNENLLHTFLSRSHVVYAQTAAFLDIKTFIVLFVLYKSFTIILIVVGHLSTGVRHRWPDSFDVLILT